MLGTVPSHIFIPWVLGGISYGIMPFNCFSSFLWNKSYSTVVAVACELTGTLFSYVKYQYINTGYLGPENSCHSEILVSEYKG